MSTEETDALDAYAEYLTDIVGQDQQTTTWHIRYTKRFLEYAVSHQLSLAELEERHLQQYFREENLTESAIGKTCTAVKFYFRYRVQLGEQSNNPFEFISHPGYPDRIHRFYTCAELERLLAMPDTSTDLGLRDRTIMQLLYDTGIRNTELRLLTLPDVDLRQKTIRIIRKRRKERLVPLLETTVDWLARYLKRRMLLFHEQGSNVLFPSTKTGQVMDISTLWRIIKKYAQQARLDDGFTVHTLRHAFASHMLANGADLRVVQILLGHSNISTTQIYAQLEQQQLKALHQRYHPRSRSQ